MTKFFDKKFETMSREELKKLQNERLIKTVHDTYKASPYYKKLWDSSRLDVANFRGIADLHKIPFIKKDDLRNAYPFGLLAKKLEDCVRIHSTSGTTGKRVIAFYTEHDLDEWSTTVARALTAAGAGKGDVVQIAFGYGLFTGGMGLHDGSRKIGALTLPMSSGSTDRQIEFMIDLGTTFLACTPSYAAYLAETIKERGLLDKIKLKAGIFGAEAWSQEMREDLQNTLGIKAYDIYGLTELEGPGVAYECECQDGMHINEDKFIAEIIDPETGEVLPAGQKGELVFTSITREAFPMIRYRTRDIAILNEVPCSCGRTFVRMSKPLGRSDDMLIVKGVNVFPSQIESVLIAKGYTSNYQIVVDRVGTTDTLDIYVEITQEQFSDDLAKIAAKEKDIVFALKASLGIFGTVHLVSKYSIERSEGKAKRVIDKRKLY
ncbi:MAG: phenylacetate--CoA ligase [Synergistaceae bacterium]|nr:phenylacetate--CoA ligase [Synergistaceae bacterium]